MNHETHFSSEDSSNTSNDTSTQVIMTHLHARVVQLEAEVATLQKQRSQIPFISAFVRMIVSVFRSPSSFLSFFRRLLSRLKSRVFFWKKPVPDEGNEETALELSSSEDINTTTSSSHHSHQSHQSHHESHEVGSLEHEEAHLAELPLMTRMTVITFVSLLLGWASESLLPFAIVAWVLYGIAYINGSFYSILEAWESLKQRQLNIDLLMIAAAIGAAAIGQPREGALLLFLFSLSHTLETYAMGRTHASLRSLISMTPKTARVVQGKGSAEQEEILPVEHVQVGIRVRIRPGEQIPTDGVVVRGSSSVNEASITGESLPVEKQVESQVFAGTINGQGVLDVEVTKPIEDSMLSQVVKVVREAREKKARSQHFTDRIIGTYYVYVVVAMTILAMVIPLVFLGEDIQTTIYRALTLMVAASPCALVISIPSAILSALASSSWSGVLFKGGKHLESASKVNIIAFDKTGTLTTGRPSVVAIMPFEEIEHGLALFDQQSVNANTNKEHPLTLPQAQLLAIAAAIERFSEHPLAQAIVDESRKYNLVLPDASDFEAQAGFGIQAYLNGHFVQIGRASLFQQGDQQPVSDSSQTLIAEQEAKGCTVVFIGTKEKIWGAIALADTVRPESRDVVQRLKRVGIEQVVLLTGDNRAVAEHVAQLVGIDEIHAELTPTQKVEAIRQIQARGGSVAMVGDGVNDAPALATATLGVAMGAAGTDVAMESSDVVLMSDDISRLPGMLRLAKRTHQALWQNLIFAFAVIVILILSTLFVGLPLTLATIAHEGSTLIVVANGLRLLVPWR